jgi:GntR family transcriptional regulator
MHFTVNPSDDLPIYRQLMRQIVDAIAGGRLQGGDKLASHRELSEQLVIAPLTVKKAYDELETLGYIETQRGRGTFVAARLPKVSRAAQSAALAQAARALLSQAYLAGLQFVDVVRLLKDADRDLTDGPVPRHRKDGAGA